VDTTWSIRANLKADLMRIRLPPKVKARLAARAKENGRSMNAEVTNILRKEMNMQNYCVIFKHLGLYYIASRETPDLRDGPYTTKAAVLNDARQVHEARGIDPDIVQDLTDADEEQLAEYLR